MHYLVSGNQTHIRRPCCSDSSESSGTSFVFSTFVLPARGRKNKSSAGSARPPGRNLNQSYNNKYNNNSNQHCNDNIVLHSFTFFAGASRGAPTGYFRHVAVSWEKKTAYRHVASPSLPLKYFPLEPYKAPNSLMARLKSFLKACKSFLNSRHPVANKVFFPYKGLIFRIKAFFSL